MWLEQCSVLICKQQWIFQCEQSPTWWPWHIMASVYLVHFPFNFKYLLLLLVPQNNLLYKSIRLLYRKMCLSKICQNPVGLKLHEKMRPQIQRFLWRRNFGGNSGSRKCERHTTLWHSPILGSFNFQKISILIHLFALWSNFNSFSFVLFLFLKRTT